MLRAHGISVYLNALAIGYRDSSDQMYLEQDYGGGIGFYPVRSDRQSLELTGDLIHVSEHFYGYVPPKLCTESPPDPRWKLESPPSPFSV